MFGGGTTWEDRGVDRRRASSSGRISWPQTRDDNLPSTAPTGDQDSFFLWNISPLHFLARPSTITNMFSEFERAPPSLNWLFPQQGRNNGSSQRT